MKISLDPMPRLRARAAQQVNGYFAQLAAVEAHRDQAHREKRQIARRVLDQGAQAASAAFAEEAALRGLPVDELARTVIAKPDTFAARELRRQRIMIEIERATTPAALGAVLKSHAI